MKRLLVLLTGFFLQFPTWVQAQQTVNIAEVFAPGYQHHVSCRVEIAGSLALPADKENPARSLPVKGESAIEYDERMLTQKDRLIDKSIRVYSRLDFDRKVGAEIQKSALRAEVRRMVILRHQQFEVPFCPTGPMTWGEIDIIRTDVFTPALAGLYPAGAVKLGERWQASRLALQELTDLERIEEGGLECRLDSVATLSGQRQARVSFSGSIKGIGEDGGARHQLEGYYFFDLDANYLSYLYVKGSQVLLDKDGQQKGKIDGTFVLTRQPGVQNRELGDDALRALTLDPNEQNSLLLYDNAELGIRFLYPRRWHVAGVHNNQIALDENHGNGLLITVETPSTCPTGAQYQQEVRNWLTQQKAVVARIDPPSPLPGTNIEHFAVDAELNKQRVILDYYTLRQDSAGTTIAGRLLPTEAAVLQREVTSIARSIELKKR